MNLDEFQSVEVEWCTIATCRPFQLTILGFSEYLKVTLTDYTVITHSSIFLLNEKLYLKAIQFQSEKTDECDIFKYFQPDKSIFNDFTDFLWLWFLLENQNSKQIFDWNFHLELRRTSGHHRKEVNPFFAEVLDPT